MATPFKEHVSPAAVEALAVVVAGAVPGFDRGAFVRAACDGLDALELKARVGQIAGALADALPGPFAADAPRVSRAIGVSDLGMWEAWAAMTWIERYGLGEPEVALDAIAAFTENASGEMAVRPYLDRWPDVAWPRFEAWARSDDEHLRRLASEGSRPRLPWAARVPALLERPERGIALLDALREDDAEYVRRSVANHLNDVAKDHPELALEVAARWRAAGGEHVDRVLRHALRGLVKAGDPRALALIGVDADVPLDVGPLTLVPERVPIGGSVELRADIRSRADVAARVAVDYAIAFVGARGAAKAPKVFKLAVRELAPGETWSVRRRHALRHVSIRTLHPGEHRVDLQVNGVVRASATFELVADGSAQDLHTEPTRRRRRAP